MVRRMNNFQEEFLSKDANLSSVCINYQEAGEHKPEHIHSSTHFFRNIFESSKGN